MTDCHAPHGSSQARVTALRASAYRIPTDAPEADGALAWDKTTMVLVTAQAGGQRGIGWSYASAAAAALVDEMLAGTVVGQDAFDVAGWPRRWRGRYATRGGPRRARA